MNDQALQKARQDLGEPVLLEFSDDLRRTKRNLLIVSSIAIFAYLSEIKITEAGFLGFKFSNPDQFWLQLGVLSVVGYLFVQFCWRAIDYIMHTRLRVTGTRLSHVTTGKFASEYGDYPDDPAQSTLYSWWESETRKIGNLTAVADTLHKVAADLEQLAKRPDNVDMPNINHVMKSSGGINREAAKLNRQLEETQKAITSARIPASLERFDRWFGCFPKSQARRLLILDIGFPYIFGAVACGLSLRVLIQGL